MIPKACGVIINTIINYYVTSGQRWIRKAWSACEAVYLECISTWYDMGDGDIFILIVLSEAVRGMVKIYSN